MQKYVERAQQQRAYASDSEGGPSTSATGTVPRGVTKSKKDMRGSTDLYTEIRPSILSAERVTITQHSGMDSATRNLQLIFWQVSYIMCAPSVTLYAICNWHLHARRLQRGVRKDAGDDNRPISCIPVKSLIFVDSEKQTGSKVLH